MTDYELQTGDELYYRKSDESHTIAFIDEHSYQLEGSDIAKDVVLLRRRIENGEIEHRPIRADGGEESAERDLAVGDVVYYTHTDEHWTIEWLDEHTIRYEGRKGSEDVAVVLHWLQEGKYELVEGDTTEDR